MSSNDPADNNGSPTGSGQDLTDDWQSAFQAEEKNQQPPRQQPVNSEPAATASKKSSLSLPNGSGRIIISLGLIGLIGLALIFSRLNNAELANLKETKAQEAAKNTTPNNDESIIPDPAPALPPTPANTAMTEPIRKKWAMPSFLFSASSADDKLQLLVSAHLTLVLLLPPRENLPQNQKIAIRNTIYGFFQSQPAKRLKHFALARGEMIKQLETRLRQQWPNLPLSSVMIERYYVQD